jgi:hypothetical protein
MRCDLLHRQAGRFQEVLASNQGQREFLVQILLDPKQ